MRAEYRKDEKSRLKRLAKYSLEHDVTLHSPEPSGEQTYRSILEGIINAIWKSEGRTDRVINLAQKPIEEPHLVEGDPSTNINNYTGRDCQLFRQILPEVASAKDDEIRLIQENAELKKDIQFFQAEGDNTGKENDELKKQIDQLEEQINTHEATIDDLRRTLSEKKEIISNQQGDIQSLQQQITDSDTTIGALHQTLSEKKEIISDKDREIQSLQTENRNKDKKNGELRQQVDQLQEINTHPEIRDIAVKATGNDQEFEKRFRTLDIDENTPSDLRGWLEDLLKQALSIGPNDRTGLSSLINEYTNFDVEYSTEPSRFDKSDNYLAHVIRTQGNSILHHESRIDSRTRIGRSLCCFFAAALLSPKLSRSDQASTASKNTHREQQDQRLSQSDYTSPKPSKSIKPKSHNAEAHYNRGVIYRQNGDCDRAIEEYTKAIKLNPNYIEAYRSRGTAYYHKGDYERAIEEYTKAIQRHPKYAEAYYDRGTAYYHKGDYERAIAGYTKAIELKPSYVKAYQSRGQAYKKKGNRAHAQADLYKAKQLQK